MKIAIISLGCPKNQVDADVFCRALIEAGHQTVPDTALADVVIVNTCGFIESAKEEAIEAIFDACALKRQNPALKVIASGCLAERYREEMAAEIPELDAVVGIGSNARLPEIVAQLTTDDAGPQATDLSKQAGPLCAFGPKAALPLDGRRVISTPGHYAWLKIAEGCSNACAYCAIPAIRGPFRSRAMDSVVAEAEWLAQQGVKELVLVAQDVTAYGQDMGGRLLPQLLDRLNAVAGVAWIRLLYAYPEKIDDLLLDAMARNDKVLHYLDLPIQHIDDAILASMGRRGGSKAIHLAIEKIRHKLPDATLRTALIAGYPGETEEQFEALCRFVQQAQFDRLGCFAYSPEEGTRAATLPGQLPAEERERRAETVMALQQRIMADKQEAMIGQRMVVLCDSHDAEQDAWLCHGAADAPEIDALVLVPGDAPLQPGQFYQVEATGLCGLDLEARLLGPC